MIIVVSCLVPNLDRFVLYIDTCTPITSPSYQRSGFSNDNDDDRRSSWGGGAADPVLLGP